MKLLIVTQKVDKNDPILGFFHRWIIEFAKYCESVTVICLEKGTYELPINVKVLSLGKDEKVSQPTYIWRFYSYIWKERKNYEAVFVHMNQEYIILAGIIWKMLSKKIFFWRNHAQGDVFTRIAVAFSKKVFYTSDQSFTARSSKALIMPVGIDTEFFVPNRNMKKDKGSILCLGRISPVKRIETIIHAVACLREENIPVHLTIVGNPSSNHHRYYEDLKNLTRNVNVSEVVEFKSGVTQYETIQFYNSNRIFINATPAGSADKTIFEAMACGMSVITSNPMLSDCPSVRIFKNDDELVPVLRSIYMRDIQQDIGVGESARAYVVARHSLSMLMNGLMGEISNV